MDSFEDAKRRVRGVVDTEVFDARLTAGTDGGRMKVVSCHMQYNDEADLENAQDYLLQLLKKPPLKGYTVLPPKSATNDTDDIVVRNRNNEEVMRVQRHSDPVTGSHSLSFLINEPEKNKEILKRVKNIIEKEQRPEQETFIVIDSYPNVEAVVAISKIFGVDKIRFASGSIPNKNPEYDTHMTALNEAGFTNFNPPSESQRTSSSPR